ncbi:enoyl-CoA hydratase [Pseudomonas sp. BAY1663]|uniref:3-hydroxyacyl-CoA dehydrogenase n=2 Tax=Stutzerimonas TaxID=2901164 RepID=A0A2N8T9P0_STUST|nr:MULTISPECIES: 3-hydroxyacyl-CoA dehydrogenase NAD-binding domain-containing protein [Pseudomonadaceae]EXF44520.1 enoyl-CoA hydratase [Pseudomonas sp. BAY1663]MCQ4327148.1 3-hydroxyacyl-CoA dehydrogenase NAD-binding domain-containing protein [Stutzerimonas stutzeri]PNG11480.1 3-hydroxyacyl-CoA dehydrogenase [Stutzerimonas stutzeri]
MTEVVRLEKRGEIALITVDNPPVNALGKAVRQGLLQAFRAAEADAAVRAVVLACAGNTFIAGADIKEFGKPPQAPALPDVIDAIEACGKPSVAVIHGTALGGGLEVALGCHYRIARKDAQAGLPEVKLGLLPGAGGTQRLPRLAGVAKALEMIVSGQPIGAAEAVAHRIVDELFEGDVAEAGLAYARLMLEEGRVPRRTGEQTVGLEGADNAGLVAAKHAEVAKRMPGLFSPLRCIAAVEAATRLPLAEGLARERELFLECLNSPQRAALVHAFFAERQASRIADLPADVQPRAIDTAAVIGGGTMGVGIALCFANAGVPVKLLEIDEEALQRGLQRARDTYAASVKRGSLTPEAMEERLKLVEGVTEYAALADVDVVVEAVFEDMAVKQQVFEQLDAVCKPGAILASNTSSLDLNAIAGFTRRPQDVVGLHFFSPANVMRLLEVVRGEKTSHAVLASAMAIGKRLKKVAVVVGVCDGFVGNRMVFQYGREAEFLLEEGATPQQVDAALRNFGMAMGPFAMRDLSGLDIGQAIRKRQRATLPAHLDFPTVSDKLCAAGMLGQKTGAGYYRYEPGNRTPQENPELAPMLEAASREKGIERQTLDERYIVERCIFALVNEGAKILEEGIAQRSSDIDVIYLNGYGFPAFRGGPMYYADSVGLDKVLARVKELHARCGDWWKPAPLLEKLAAEGRTFTEWQAGR